MNDFGIEDVQSLATGMNPKALAHFGKRLGTRMRRHEREKRIVGAYTCLRYIENGQELFIADGSSAYWTALAIFATGKKVEIKTNNLAIAMEVTEWDCNANVYIAEGKVDANLDAVFGHKAEDFCAESAQAAHLSIVPVSHISFERGPCASTPGARRIKLISIPVSPKLILLADSSKVKSNKSSTGSPAVFTGTHRQYWEQARDSGHATLVCDWPADLDGDFASEMCKFCASPIDVEKVCLPGRCSGEDCNPSGRCSLCDLSWHSD